MLYIKACHIISMVAWFAGLFYLPRLFVYHSESQDLISNVRFKIMERRLYYGISWPAAIGTTFLGIWLLSYNPSFYLSAAWMQAKIGLVILLWVYHLSLGHYMRKFATDNNNKKSIFYRFFNELPTIFLLFIVVLVVVKPF